MKIEDEAKRFEAYLAQLGYVKGIRCKECMYDHACTHEMVRKSSDGGNIYCPVEYCSEGKRKEHAID